MNILKCNEHGSYLSLVQAVLARSEVSKECCYRAGQAANDGASFLNGLHAKRPQVMPNIYFSEDGSLVMEYITSAGSALIMLYGDQTIAYTIKTTERFYLSIQEFALNTQIPEKLSLILYPMTSQIFDTIKCELY